MSRSYWLYFIALGGYLIASCAIGQDRAENNKPVADQTEQQPQTDADAIKAAFDRVFWSEHSGNAETYRAICEHPKDRDYADLCQQWRTAEATKEQAKWAFPQFSANVLTVLGLIATIIITVTGTKAATRAARAAEDAVAIAQNTAKQELRAYISVEARPWDIVEDEQNRMFLASVVYMNVGQTPARNIHYRHRVDIEADGAVIDWNAGHWHKSDLTMHPGQGRQLTARYKKPFSQEVEERVRRKNATIYLFGKITYDDGFSPDRRETNFRIKIDGKVLNREDREFLIYSDEGNSAT